MVETRARAKKVCTQSHSKWYIFTDNPTSKRHDAEGLDLGKELFKCTKEIRNGYTSARTTGASACSPICCHWNHGLHARVVYYSINHMSMSHLCVCPGLVFVFPEMFNVAMPSDRTRTNQFFRFWRGCGTHWRYVVTRCQTEKQTKNPIDTAVQ